VGDHKSHASSVVETFNNDDWDGASRFFGASTYNELGTQRSLKGTDIVDALKGWKTAMPDVKGTITGAEEVGNQVILEVTWHGTHTGPLATPQGEIPPSGKSHTTPSAWIFDYEGDSLVESRHYFDMLTILQQIGAA
jgi:steroid delta-isomerase-like uncharacterized protein